MRVFRLEHGSTGDGPWNARGFLARLNNARSSSLLRELMRYSQGDSHPSLYEDWPDNRSSMFMGKHFCGMPSVEAAKHWFGKVNPKLIKECGFKFRVFEIPDEDVIIGKSQKQVFFKRGREQLVEEKESLYDLLDSNKGSKS